ncbi:hypothetical protein BDB00DRAFT_808443 [Zychaea mexicana]|uniref:uncharacterized protein n=1 Tax=Zychaea mexicana TaxID=64656 RepID=UPI0022FDF7EF|nr:uncharacterized protein BDB00DRAFT_808443 [Zychaea mexicana]KAI9496714.1 hypothetical protein BDB00DRAFT_808443 [Zychaea mexicana]
MRSLFLYLLPSLINYIIAVFLRFAYIAFVVIEITVSFKKKKVFSIKSPNHGLCFVLLDSTLFLNTKKKKAMCYPRELIQNFWDIA